jgi:hypothetical protein
MIHYTIPELNFALQCPVPQPVVLRLAHRPRPPRVRTAPPASPTSTEPYPENMDQSGYKMVTRTERAACASNSRDVYVFDTPEFSGRNRDVY